MARPLVTDDLWEIIEPLLPPPLPRRRDRRRRGGRPPVDDRKVLAGVVFVLRTGVPRESLPREMGCGCGMTCWRRLRDWQQAGVWTKLHRVLLDRLGAANAIDWTRCSLDSASIPAKRGAKRPARTRRIAADRAARGMSWSTRTASRSPWS